LKSFRLFVMNGSSECPYYTERGESAPLGSDVKTQQANESA
jgi:hypothetical protein